MYPFAGALGDTHSVSIYHVQYTQHMYPWLGESWPPLRLTATDCDSLAPKIALQLIIGQNALFAFSPQSIGDLGSKRGGV